jgi:DNA-binding SARP family transcriptional activator
MDELDEIDYEQIMRALKRVESQKKASLSYYNRVVKGSEEAMQRRRDNARRHYEKKKKLKAEKEKNEKAVVESL